jgi:DNA-directed RNA polymerase specialized sigma24 family protein
MEPSSMEIRDLHESGSLAGSTSFAKAWESVKDDVFKFCSRQSINGRRIPPDDAKDLTMVIAMKIYKGLPGWRGDASLKTWVFSISHRVVVDYFDRMRIEMGRSRDLPTDGSDPRTENAIEPAGIANGPQLDSEQVWRALLKAALETKWPSTNKFFLDQLDRDILQTRLDHPRLSSKELSAYLGISATAYDARYCRAQIAIRVYGFLHRPDLLGGVPALRQRFNALVSSKPPRLNALEASVFKDMVLEKDIDSRPTGWQDALRSACTKMVYK